ncbi:hypothetical protein K474DRAFT_1708825 [Panus rudis PR-1116 ss-1]|nr:hypothetical protein K474DRAFT_1708825 [Panus rudis PR-1116 ss-1]
MDTLPFLIPSKLRSECRPVFPVEIFELIIELVLPYPLHQYRLPASFGTIDANSDSDLVSDYGLRIQTLYANKGLALGRVAKALIGQETLRKHVRVLSIALDDPTSTLFTLLPLLPDLNILVLISPAYGPAAQPHWHRTTYGLKAHSDILMAIKSLCPSITTFELRAESLIEDYPINSQSRLLAVLPNSVRHLSFIDLAIVAHNPPRRTLQLLRRPRFHVHSLALGYNGHKTVYLLQHAFSSLSCLTLRADELALRRPILWKLLFQHYSHNLKELNIYRISGQSYSNWSSHSSVTIDWSFLSSVTSLRRLHLDFNRTIHMSILLDILKSLSTSTLEELSLTTNSYLGHEDTVNHQMWRELDKWLATDTKFSSLRAVHLPLASHVVLQEEDGSTSEGPGASLDVWKQLIPCLFAKGIVYTYQLSYIAFGDVDRMFPTILTPLPNTFRVDEQRRSQWYNSPYVSSSPDSEGTRDTLWFE